jgi:hypothetical protein
MAANSSLSSLQGAALVPGGRSTWCASDVRRQVVHAAAVVHAGQRVQQSVVGVLRHFGTAMQIRNAFAQRPPLEIFFRPSLFGPVCPEVLNCVDSRFSSPQHAAPTPCADVKINLSWIRPDHAAAPVVNDKPCRKTGRSCRSSGT